MAKTKKKTDKRKLDQNKKAVRERSEKAFEAAVAATALRQSVCTMPGML